VNPGDRWPLLGGWSRNLAALIVFVSTLAMLGMASAAGWPLGPGFVDEGGITKIRMAVALLATGVAFSMLFLGFFLFDIVERLKRLERPAPPPQDQKPGPAAE
jgi:hypothetical protein